MGRPAKYTSAAERQKAFRERRKLQQPAPVLKPGEIVLSSEAAEQLRELVKERVDTLLEDIQHFSPSFVWYHHREELERLDVLAAALGGESDGMARLEQIKP